MIELPIGATKASKETVNTLLSIGALYKDDTGIHANKDGEYRVKENIPADR